MKENYSFENIIFENITDEIIKFNVLPEVKGLCYNIDKKAATKLKNSVIGNILEYVITNIICNKTLCIDNVNYNITDVNKPFDLTYKSKDGKYINIEIKSAKKFGNFTLSSINNYQQKNADYFIFILYSLNNDDVYIKNIYIKKGPYIGKTKHLSKNFIKQNSISLWK